MAETRLTSDEDKPGKREARAELNKACSALVVEEGSAIQHDAHIHRRHQEVQPALLGSFAESPRGDELEPGSASKVK